MAEIRYLSVLDVIGLHAVVMERMGQAPSPLRSPELLESAVLRPRMAAYYEGADLVRQCALLFLGLSQAQAWLDGNKRAAFAAADVFLRLNGHFFSGDPLELARRLVAGTARAGSLEEATGEFEGWLRENVARV